jgi:6-pyruvoyltetrahydropterin/6-carboxytetrahydropterin synthase
MAHALLNHDGPCKNIHGHSYHLAVTVKGKPITDNNSPKAGMVVDFSDIKKVVNDKIVSRLDHSLVLSKETAESMWKELQHLKLILVDFQPTCENMLIDIAEKLLRELPDDIKLHHLMLRETNTSYAEWYAEDNMDMK